MQRLNSFFLLAGGLLLAGARPGLAQTISGTVFDITGAVVPNSRVVLAQDFTKVAETVSDARGGFEFKKVEEGVYSVFVRSANFALWERTVTAREEKTTTVRAVLRPGEFGFGAGVVGVAGSEPAKPAPYVASAASELVRPKVLKPPRPVYPKSAADAGIEGPVVLRIRVQPDRKVDVLAVLSSPDAALEAEARRAVTETVVEPIRLGGKPVECEAEVVVEFKLKRQ